MKTLRIEKNDAGQRLDKFLQKALDNMPYSLMYKLIRKKKIKVNRLRAEPGQTLNEGDEVLLFISDEFFGLHDPNDYSHTDTDLDIVYEDKEIILVNKAPGVIVHSDDKNDSGTLIDRVKAYLIKNKEYDPQSENSFAPSLCNRIDRNTGGIVIAAKTAAALRIMNEKIKNGEITKRYLLVCHGSFEKKSGRYKNFLLKDGDANTVRVFDRPVPDGRTAITDYRVLKEKDGLSLVEATLGTGRTHQIRAQFAYYGHPLLGDGKYGINRDDRKKGFSHQALWSYKVRFDFKSDAGELAYLAGKEFEVNENKIPFTSLFSC